ncbi:MAG: sigma-70 family RNA polymerase sigma factor [Myxococcaceae bacterium]
MDLTALFTAERTRVLAAVMARVGDLALAEDVTQEAFAAAAEQWKTFPPNPKAWLLKVACNKAIDVARRRARIHEVDDSQLLEHPVALPESDEELDDDRLRLVFTCCHPALAPEVQVALTLRTVAGVPTAAIARLFLVDEKAMAQRLVRAQRKILDSKIAYRVPEPEAWPERLAAVLAVVYLLFTQGHAAVEAESSEEAIRLARLLTELMPGEPDVLAMLALLLLTDARRPARTVDGVRVPLEEQDRSKWSAAQIIEGLALVERAIGLGARGSYVVQASIAALHARASAPDQTDWPQIAGLYELLLEEQPTPVVRLNRAAAIAMVRGPMAGLEELEHLRRFLEHSSVFHAARADLLRRLDRAAEAGTAYRTALSLSTDDAERAFLERRLKSL